MSETNEKDKKYTEAQESRMAYVIKKQEERKEDKTTSKRITASDKSLKVLKDIRKLLIINIEMQHHTISHEDQNNLGQVLQAMKDDK